MLTQARLLVDQWASGLGQTDEAVLLTAVHALDEVVEYWRGTPAAAEVEKSIARNLCGTVARKSTERTAVLVSHGNPADREVWFLCKTCLRLGEMGCRGWLEPHVVIKLCDNCIALLQQGDT
jgi:hypothetical protein